MNRQLIHGCSVILLAAASLRADGSQVVARIPFPFHVGNSMLPAGSYTVESEIGPGVLRVRSADGNATVMILAHGVESRSAPAQGTLVFTKYGDEYFLSQVWRTGNNMGQELRKSRREIEIAARAGRGEVQAIVASR